MPVQILMPALSPTMTEGNLVKWLKAEGETVKAGEVIAEIETDKATMEVEAVDEGVLAKIIVPAGTESVKVNSLIALLLEEGEDASALDNIATVTAPASTTTATPPTTLTAIHQATPTIDHPKSDQRRFASPLARRIAEQHHVDLHGITGSGPHGRIIKSDIEAVITNGKASPSLAMAPTPVVYDAAGYIDLPLNNMRKVIAKRLTESKQQVPHFYLSIDCQLDALLKLRSEINARLEDQKISVNDFIVRACALALIKVPEANVAWFETYMRQYQAADISVAVAIDGGLVTPVVRSAQEKSLKEISMEVKSLAERARAGKLAPEDYQGGTFTISNLGMYGIKQFAAILNPPQACILAIGAGEQRALIKDGQMSIATVMTCTLSVDHRAVDGAIGSQFLAIFKKLIEDPLQLII